MVLYVLIVGIYLLVTYAICSIPFGVVVAERLGGVDVRSVGSGNIGTTNVGRATGKAGAGLTLLLDAGKGFLCCILAKPVFSALLFAGDGSSLNFGARYDWLLALIFLVCLVGHVYSGYLHFHGGKGIAVGFGSHLGLLPGVALGLLAVFIAFSVPTRYVSLGSCMAAISLPVWWIVLAHPSLPFVLIMCVASTLVVFAHRENIKRLMAGEESKFSFSSATEDNKGDQ